MNQRLRLTGRLQLFMQANLLLGVLLAIADVWIYTINVRAGLVLSGFVVLYLILTLVIVNFSKSVLMNELISFATKYGQIQKQLLKDFEVASALLDENGKIIWTNREFDNLCGKPKGFGKDVRNMFPAITRERFPKEADELTEVSFSKDEMEFTAKMRRIPLTQMVENSEVFRTDEKYEGCLIALYLFDETALKLALRENDNQSLCIGLLYIDNYEEALESIEEVRRSLLTALIERKLNKYFASYDGVVKKLEKDKFFVILRKQSLRQLQENRFDVLEDVKTVNIGNDMSVTLSIGIGSDGLSYGQNYEFARTSIDLALGRGGDQAVIKTPEGVNYYGGKSLSVEKNTRVKARVKALALKEIVSTKDKVMVMGHQDADVDSFGAAVGIFRMAKSLGRSVYIVIDNVNASTRPWVDAFDGLDPDEVTVIGNSQALEIADNNTVLIVVDVNKPSRTQCPELLKICRTTVVLDHHRQGEEVIENATLSYVEPYASSACEMVAEILQYIGDGVKIRSLEADCIYAGIVVDTGNFINKAGVRTFEAAAFLRRNGADVTRVRKMFRENADDYRARAEAVGQASIYRKEFAISVCQADKTSSPTVIGAQAANELLDITGIKASFVLTSYNNMIYISARSIDEVNVQIIMEKLGGGGHMNMAGAQLEDITLEDAIEKLKETLDQMCEDKEI
ncbi:MAG: DHH family phosphoesterase [Lachnospiraceae bacterium]|nr:DHH family phosphoesterase [Lachnospiraceae bacterium]